MEIIPTRRIATAFFGGLLTLPAIFLLFVWFSQFALAETAILDPAGDGTVNAARTGCAGTGNFECLNDGVRSPTDPNTSTDYLQFGNETLDFYTLESLGSVDTVNSITFYLFHTNTGSTNMRFDLQLFAGNETTTLTGAQSFPQRTAAQWDSVTFTGLSLTQAQLDDMRVRLICTRNSSGQPGGCRAFALYAVVDYDPVIDVTVDSLGTQQNVIAGTTNQYVGGAFTFTRNVGSGDITSIRIRETGTIDAENDLSNVRLFYDLDTTSPYDCTSESFSGTESQFGSAASFNGPNGTATFTDTVAITMTQTMCVYVVVDVEESANAGDTIAIEITDPTADVGFTGSFIEPDDPVTISGVSIVQRSELVQTGYHWRNDDGSQTTASSVTGGSQNTPFAAAPRETTLRLRTAISNDGNINSQAAQYQLEYGVRVTTCDAVSSWNAVGATNALWEMSPTSNLTDGADSVVIPVADGGVTSPNTTLLSPNGGIRDTNNLTGSLTLTPTQFVLLEFAIEATANAGDGVDYCFRFTDNGTPLDTYDVYPQATTFSDLTVEALGTQVVNVDIPSTDIYAGGTFRITDQTIGAHEITSVSITANGSADPQDTFANVRLFYDLDTTAPYDCGSESFSLSDAQFGSSTTFNSVGRATFTDSISVDPQQTVCFYVVYDVTSNAVDGTTFELSIADPSTDVVIDQGDIGPAAAVSIDGTTTFIRTIVRQYGYHWRNNDGSEADATSATEGQSNTSLGQLRIGSPIRVRLGVENAGGKAADPQSFRLEWARRVSTCAAATGWTDVGATGGDWNMSPSANLTDGAHTTNIATSTGGIPDPQPTFISTNGGVRDTTSQTGAITLTSYSFVELEYSIEATSNAVEGGTYCLRVTDAGTPLPTYTTYPIATIKEPTDFLVQRGFVTITGTSATINAGTNYEAPSSASNAFIRITNTMNTGAGGGTTGNANNTTVYISNPSNITSSITFTRPAGASGSTRVAWEIVEYIGAPGGQNEMIVREQSSVTYGGTAVSATTGTVSGVVDDDQVAIFVTGQLNPDTSTNYQRGLSTAVWNGGSNTATFTRGESGGASIVSYAVVEFTGSNWRVQRVEHNYTVAGSTQTQSISPVNSLSRAFLHTQKRMGAGANTHGDFGHQVWLSGIGQVSFALDSTATNISSHTSVAWVIENIQVAGERMIVTSSNGTQSGGTNPTTLNVNIGKTLDDLEIASIFMNNSGTEFGIGPGQNSFPEPMMSARIISSTQYELWIADTDDSRSYRTEIVEWPTAARTFAQNHYRWYANNDALTPSDPWPEGAQNIAENAELGLDDEPVGAGQAIRLRMSVEIDAAGKVPGVDAFVLQYGERVTSCAAVSEWSDVEGPSSSSLWRGFATPVSAGTALSGNPPTSGDLLLSVSDIAGTYEEGGSSAFTPFTANPGDNVEFDWSLQHNGAKEETVYCFRMIESNGLEFLSYNFYPTLLTAAYRPIVTNWRWYENDSSLTPTSALASELVAPIDLENDAVYRLRVAVTETAGAPGEDIKFAVQFSEYVDFRTVETLVATSSCEGNSLWCYAESVGVDNTIIDETVLSGSDSCSGGSGAGCGTFNSSVSTTTLSFTQEPFSVTEFEFVLRHAGARAGAVYYFRLYDLVNDRVVMASTSNPSALTQGAQLVFTVDGLPSNTQTAGVVTNATTTPSSVAIANIPVNTAYHAAHRLRVDTNATDGYQVFMFSDQHPTNVYGDIIEPITSTNAAPAGWNTACNLTLQNSCFGYHTTDAVLEGGSTRFSALDSYAAFEFGPQEVMYSPVPVDEQHDIVYKIEVNAAQPAGAYQSDVVFLAVPRF